MRRAAICLMLLPACLVAQPEWVGVMTSPARVLFAVRAAPDAPSRWVGLGAPCGDYTLAAFDATAGRLSLRRGNATLVLTLAAGSGRGADQPHPTLATLDAATRDTVRRRDGWTTGVQLEPPQPYGGGYRVLVRHAVDGRTECRVVILNATGRVVDCWRA